MIGSGDEILEGVLLGFHLAGFVPFETLVLAAANMGDGIDETTVGERQCGGGEGGGNGDAVSAITIKQARGGTVKRHILAIEQGDRHQLAIMRRGHDAAGDVIIRIVAGRHFLRLQQCALARHHVIIEQLARRRHRGIGEADDVGVIFRRAMQAERIGLFGKGDGMFLAGAAVADDDARQAVAAFQPDQVAGIGIDGENEAALLMRYDFFPVFLARRCHRRFHDAEILGVAVIGEDEKDIAAFAHRIFDAFFALRYDSRLGRQVFGGENAIFAGLMVVNVDEDEIVENRRADAHEETGILFLIDQPVGRLRLADDMVEDLGGTVVLVLQRIEEALAIGRPCAAAAGVFHDIGKVFAGFEVADAQGEIFRALVVITPDAVAVIGGLVETGETEIILALGLLVAVQQHVFFAAAARGAEIMRLLAAGHEQCPVSIRPVIDRHGGIILLDAALHFRKQLFLKRLGVTHRRFHIGVFRFQMGADRRVEQGRVLEHGLPVIGPEPCIIVGAGNAVMRILNGPFFGGRGGGQVLENRQGKLAFV